MNDAGLNKVQAERLDHINRVLKRLAMIRPTEKEAGLMLDHLTTINPVAVAEALDLLALRRRHNPRPVTPGSRTDRGARGNGKRARRGN